MRISGFSMVRNADSLYYPIKQAIASILPIVDEFVLALGDCTEGDRTREEVLSLNSPKLRIIDTVWDLHTYPNGMENAHQTDIAREACTGDWLFYLQADEVVHEQDLDTIVRRCEQLLEDPDVEGLLFDYYHFWGDYAHHQKSHGWYPYEIRIIRNDPDIHSWESAQSFRRIPNFGGLTYRQQSGTSKLKVAKANASIYHYGWVRPPALMQNKRKALDTIHKGSDKVQAMYAGDASEFDYGPLNLCSRFEGSHPEVMREWIERFDWADALREGGPLPKNRMRFKHEKLKYRIVTWIEQHLLNGRRLGEFQNYQLLTDK